MCNISKCKIWSAPAEVFRDESMGRGGGGYRVKSLRAGGCYQYLDGFFDPNTLDDQTKAKLTSWILEQNEKNPNQYAVISSEVMTEVKARKSMLIMEKCDRYLEKIFEFNPKPGATFRSMFTGNSKEELTRALYECNSEEEDRILALTESIDRGDVKFIEDQMVNELQYLKRTNFIEFLLITFRGHQRIEELHQTNADSNQGFVAMWFDESINDLWSMVFEPAIEEAGYKPQRIDEKDHNNKICDEIVAEIKRSRFVIADFTSEQDKPRGGVYYEAGFAQGLGIPVIWTCREDLIGNIHFDTRQFNHIPWRDWTAQEEKDGEPEKAKERSINDFKKKLVDRIRATIGQGPLKDWPEGRN